VAVKQTDLLTLMARKKLTIWPNGLDDSKRFDRLVSSPVSSLSWEILRAITSDQLLLTPQHWQLIPQFLNFQE
jgi:hypothetical protein